MRRNKWPTLDWLSISWGKNMICEQQPNSQNVWLHGKHYWLLQKKGWKKNTRLKMHFTALNPIKLLISIKTNVEPIIIIMKICTNISVSILSIETSVPRGPLWQIYWPCTVLRHKFWTLPARYSLYTQYILDQLADIWSVSHQRSAGHSRSE